MLKQRFLSGPADKCEGQEAQDNEQARKVRKFKGMGRWHLAKRREQLDRIVANFRAERTVPGALIRATLLGPPPVSKRENRAPAPPSFLNQASADPDLNVKSGCRTEKNKAHWTSQT